jgi:hypothetical protein
MDRIIHQSPRQQGYGSTSSLKNDSLKHTRKHNKGREESNQEAKHSGSGGPSGQEGRTVRTGHADRSACCHGLSAHTPRTIRPCAADHPKKLTEPPETTPNNGSSAGSLRTVRQAPADRPPADVDCPKPHPTKTQSHNGSQVKPSKNMKNMGRTRSSRTVRRSLADCPRLTDRTENSPTSKVNSPKSSSDFPDGRSCEDKVWGLEKRHIRMI